MNFKNKTLECDYKKYLNKIDKKVLFIYSNTSIIINKYKLNGKFINIDTKKLTQNIKTIDSIIKEIPSFDSVIAFGGGTAIDIAKYIGAKLQEQVIVIPAMISTNAYATNKVSLYKNGKKMTMLAKEPDIILIDRKVLSKTKKMNVYGLADVLSIYTALNDWDLAIKHNNEKITIEYSMAHELLLNTLSFINSNSYSQICNNPTMIYELVGISGEVTNTYGCGKPESGSEHIFAKELEKIINVPHSISVCNGILLMSLLQNKYSVDVYNAIKKLKIFDDEYKYGINKNIIKNAFLNLNIREDRFTIINLENNYLETFEKFLDIRGDIKDDCS